jgi:exodeoxyribonuclease VII small subunit
MMAAKKPQKGSLETSLKRLEEIVESLEEGKVSLDDAVKLYEEGIVISKDCVEKLKTTELKIRKLAKSVGGDFEIAETDEA